MNTDNMKRHPGEENRAGYGWKDERKKEEEESGRPEH
jgi:hypothetical protein